MRVDIAVKGQVVVKIGGVEKYLSGGGCEVPQEVGKTLISSGLAKQSTTTTKTKARR